MEAILKSTDARVRILKQKSGMISAALISGNHTAEHNLFQAQYNWQELEDGLTARACQTISRALDLWHQAFVS